MGWLGWHPKVALRADVNVIMLAIEGREDMLKAIFGEASDGAKDKAPMTADRFRRFAQSHNQRFRNRRSG